MRIFIKDLFILVYQNVCFIAKPKTIPIFSTFKPNLIAPHVDANRPRQLRAYNQCCDSLLFTFGSLIYLILSRLKCIESCRVVSRVSSGVSGELWSSGVTIWWWLFGFGVVHINDQPRTSTKQWLHIFGDCESSLSTPNSSHASIDNLTKIFVEARK